MKSTTVAMSGDARYRRTINAWCMYDWANSAFATTIMAALFPPFYRSLVTGAGLSASTATAYWGYTTAGALLLVAMIGPVLGAIADDAGGKKKFTAVFAAVGVLATATMVILKDDTWRLGSLLFILGNIGFAGANIFYESLLPHIARSQDVDRVSARGYAIGYVGGGLLLCLNALWVLKPQLFGLPDVERALHASFVSVAAWWAFFSLPFFRRVPEPPLPPEQARSIHPLRGAFARMAATFRDIRRYRQLLIFLLAFWVYNDGIGTIIKMATAYGHEIGIGVGHMTAALVITQFIGIPFTFWFGALAARIGAKRCILLTLGVYTLISIAGYFMRSATHFFVLAVMVGMVQGGSQALSRSLYSAMVPRHKAAEFFGFYSTSAKFAGIAGPLLFGLISQSVGQSRLSILALIAFFGAGALLLSLVDVEEGIRAAQSAEIGK